MDVPEGFAWETDSQIGIYLPHHGTPDCEAIGALSGSLSEGLIAG